MVPLAQSFLSPNPLGLFRTQAMDYNTSIEPTRNKIEFIMFSGCQRSIDDKDKTWAFVLRELANIC